MVKLKTRLKKFDVDTISKYLSIITILSLSYLLYIKIVDKNIPEFYYTTTLAVTGINLLLRSSVKGIIKFFKGDKRRWVIMHGILGLVGLSALVLSILVLPFVNVPVLDNLSASIFTISIAIISTLMNTVI